MNGHVPAAVRAAPTSTRLHSNAHEGLGAQGGLGLEVLIIWRILLLELFVSRMLPVACLIHHSLWTLILLTQCNRTELGGITQAGTEKRTSLF